jgi:hypothetical protein
MRPIACVAFAALCLLLSCSEKERTDPDVVYFLVAEKEAEHGDSYILPLKDPLHIAEARQIIAEHQDKIVTAEISKDATDPYPVNRDLVGHRTWSWHVSEFSGFGDMTIEILDGWPTYVEDHYDAWVSTTKGPNGKGRIGFWNYTLVREVSAAELTEEH